MLVSTFLLLTLIGSDVKAINNLGGPRKDFKLSPPKKRDRGLDSVDSMTEHQYLGKYKELGTFTNFKPSRSNYFVTFVSIRSPNRPR